MLQPARLGIKPRPVVERKIYNDEAGRWQLFVDAFPCSEVSRNNQAHRDIVQARIVPDDEEHLRMCGPTDDADQPYVQCRCVRPSPPAAPEKKPVRRVPRFLPRAPPAIRGQGPARDQDERCGCR